MKKLIHEEIQRIRLTESEAAGPSNRFPFIAILDNIRSLYNVGSIFRTADGARTEAIYTVGYTPHPPRPEIEKTALGATRTVPTHHFENIADAISAARELGFAVAALELTDSSRSVYDLTKTDFPMALIIGNEITGVSREALELIDFAVDIPMLGAKHSLNVSVAYGVCLYEALRGYRAQFEAFLPQSV
jgi:tRNA G18 (ribose-2'-O)-methylase SpoU